MKKREKQRIFLGSTAHTSRHKHHIDWLRNKTHRPKTTFKFISAAEKISAYISTTFFISCHMWSALKCVCDYFIK